MENEGKWRSLQLTFNNASLWFVGSLTDLNAAPGEKESARMRARKWVTETRHCKHKLMWNSCYNLYFEAEEISACYSEPGPNTTMCWRSEDYRVDVSLLQRITRCVFTFLYVREGKKKQKQKSFSFDRIAGKMGAAGLFMLRRWRRNGV